MVQEIDSWKEWADHWRNLCQAQEDEAAMFYYRLFMKQEQTKQAMEEMKQTVAQAKADCWRYHQQQHPAHSGKKI